MKALTLISSILLLFILCFSSATAQAGSTPLDKVCGQVQKVQVNDGDVKLQILVNLKTSIVPITIVPVTEKSEGWHTSLLANPKSGRVCLTGDLKFSDGEFKIFTYEIEFGLNKSRHRRDSGFSTGNQ